MQKLSLFLGFSMQIEWMLPALLEKAVASDHEHLYLQKITHNKQTYLGKMIENPSDFQSLALLEKNILSLYRQFFPTDFTPSLTLLTIQHDESN